jgi:diguanylate cyclase (GGDEF)-like protein
MLSSLSATEVAFVLIAVVQMAAALTWALGACFVPEERAAMGHWAAYAALSASTWVVLSLTLHSPPLLGVLAGVCGAIALRRGIQIFVGRLQGLGGSALLLVLVVAAGALGADTTWRPLQAAVNFGVLAWLYLSMAFELRRFAHGHLQWRWPWLLAAPLLLGAFGFASRALRAVWWPDSVLTEMTVHSALNVGSAIGYIVLVLLMHATLMTLVVSRLLHDLRRLARRDGLTGLLNRRAMHELLDQHARQRRRAEDSFSVLMIDVDHFKAVNDLHGHATGDLALRHIARCLTLALRTEDRIARFGGEEFVVLLPGCGVVRATAEAERLRLGVQAAPLIEGGATVGLTVSIGVAEWAGTVEEVSRLLVRADEALYRAKHLGRNRVESAGPSPATPQPQGA